MSLKAFYFGILLSLLLCGAAPVPAQQQATPLEGRIAAIADGTETAARGRAIADALKASGIDYRMDEFTVQGFTGTNIVADVQGTNATKTLLLGAHYDRVSQGNGAVDNAAGCAVLLVLLDEFKSEPLGKYSVKAVFFDLEERGLIGSRVYFARNKDTGLPAHAMNLDILGYGDTLFVHPSLEGGPLTKALEQAAKESSMPLRLIPARDQYPASDHRSMMAAGVETLAVALIDGSEIDAIAQKAGGAASNSDNHPYSGRHHR